MLKKLNQKGLSALIIIVIIAIVAVIGVVGFVLMNRNADEALTIDEIANSQISNYEAPYTIDATITDKDGNVSTFKVEMQDEDVSRTTISGPEGSLETISTADAIYTKLPGADTWSILPKSADSDAAIGDFELSTSDIQEINNNGVVVGTADCNGKTCTEFKYTDENGDEFNVFVDNATKKLVRVTGDTEDGMIELNYTEGDVNIEIPSGDDVRDPLSDFDLGDLDLDGLGL